jgi:hypothetical protein
MEEKRVLRAPEQLVDHMTARASREEQTKISSVLDTLLCGSATPQSRKVGNTAATPKILRPRKRGSSASSRVENRTYYSLNTE